MSAPSPGDVRPDRATLLAFLGVILFGGANAIGVRQTVHELAPFWGAAIRFVAAGLIMVAIVVATRRTFPSGRSLSGAVIYGAVGFAASYGFMYMGLRETPAGTAMVLVALTPLLTFGLAIAQRQESFRAPGLLGGLIALVGVAIVFADQVSANVPVASLVLILLGILCIAETGVIVKWIPRSDPFATNAVAMLTGAGILLVLSLAAGESRVLPTQTATWAAVGYLVIFGSVVMFALFLFTLERWTASAVSYMTLLLPLVTVPLAAVLTGERISPSFVAGGVVILVGVYAGAFLKIRPGRSSASGLPECLPVDACAEALPARSVSASG
jgi:drug/metabolite transporter (DMT)-like permease